MPESNVSHSIKGGLVHLSGNPIEVTLTAIAAKTNHKLVLCVTCKTLTGIELPGSPFIEEITPLNLVSVFDVSGLVDYPAENLFDYPVIGAVVGNNIAINVSFEIGEVWTDSSNERQEVIAAPAENATIRVLKGRLRQHELSILNEQNKSFHSEYIQGGKFLTHQPVYQRVSPNHVPMLWYLSRWTTSRDISINLKVYTSLMVRQMAQSHTLWDITGMVGFAFSPAFWGMVLEPGEVVKHYEFWVNDAEGDEEGGMLDISEHRYFVVDHNYYEKSFTFFYVNPLSGIDMLWLTGGYTEGLITESETAFRPPASGAKTKTASIVTVSSTGQRVWDMNTGIKSREEMLALRDLLEAKERWMVDPDTNRIIPVLIKAGEFQLYDSMKDVQSLDIKITEAHR